jgi:uncharacterized protein
LQSPPRACSLGRPSWTVDNAGTVEEQAGPRHGGSRGIGADISHAVPLTLVAGAGHWWIGSVDWSLFVSLLIGSIPGIAIGSALAAKVPDRILRPVLAGTLALVGGRLAF